MLCRELSNAPASQNANVVMMLSAKKEDANFVVRTLPRTEPTLQKVTNCERSISSQLCLISKGPFNINILDDTLILLYPCQY